MVARIWRTQIDETRADEYRRWRDIASAQRLDQSETYKSTVAEIEATGFLRGESSIEVFELEGFFLEDAAARSGKAT
jgi:hypothetical protein